MPQNTNVPTKLYRSLIQLIPNNYKQTLYQYKELAQYMQKLRLQSKVRTCLKETNQNVKCAENSDKIRHDILYEGELLV